MVKKRYPKILKNKVVAIFIIAILLIGFTLFIMKMVDNISPNTKVKLETNQGDIIIELYPDMPITAGNFKSLVEKETYNGVIFHRIIKDFMVQGGDPTGTGMGDPSIPNIKDEFTHAGGNKNDRGTISMANAGPNTGSSQFFINVVDNNFLDGKHPTFGNVVEGMDIIDKIVTSPADSRDRPLQEIKIIKATII